MLIFLTSRWHDINNLLEREASLKYGKRTQTWYFWLYMLVINIMTIFFRLMHVATVITILAANHNGVWAGVQFQASINRFSIFDSFLKFKQNLQSNERFWRSMVQILNHIYSSKYLKLFQNFALYLSNFLKCVPLKGLIWLAIFFFLIFSQKKCVFILLG